MRVSCKIYTSKYYVDSSFIGAIKLDSIPTTSMPNAYETWRSHYLTNFIEINNIDEKYNGEYFVYKSVAYLDNHTDYPLIDMMIEKHDKQQSAFLYIKGTITHTVHEMFINVKLTGEIDAFTRAIIVPRTNLDFINFDGFYYASDKVKYFPDGSIEIHTTQKYSLEQFNGMVY